MRNQQETNSINRVMKAWGLGSLGEPGSIEALARMVQDHEHFGELLRACEPSLRRDMYDAMAPNLRFQARLLDWYVIGAKEHAESMQYPTIDDKGNLKPYMMPRVENTAENTAAAIEVPFECFWIKCARCSKESFFYADRLCDAISEMRHAGWGWDETVNARHVCPNCLDEVDGIAVDEAPS